MKLEKADKEHVLENEKKWSRELLEPGWSMIPNIFLIKQHALGLDPVDINIILQIAKHWWFADQRPFPSHARLAREMSVHVSTIKRHLSSLKKAGLIDWEQRIGPDGGRKSNVYDLSGLIKHAKQFAIEETEARRKAEEEKEARRRRRKPRLRVVDQGDEA